MGCTECREVISAQLDGEDGAAERAAADAHLDRCTACQRWRDDAVLVTRLTRTGLLSTGRGVSDEVLAAAPAPRRGGAARLLRGALGALGAVQLVLGLAQVTGFTTGHVHPGVGAGPDHLWHESAAWNVAVGAGFAWVALRRTRPAGLMPTLTAFVAVLTLLSVNDVLAGRVDTLRLLSHGFVVAGYLIVLALSYRSGDPGEPPANRRDDGPRWRARFDDPPAATPAPTLRLLPGPPADGLPAQGRADVRRAA